MYIFNTYKTIINIKFSKPKTQTFFAHFPLAFSSLKSSSGVGREPPTSPTANSNLSSAFQDINEIIKLCASSVWQERKDGLVSLKYYLNSGTQLTPGELKHITEIFTRMFMDSHTKSLGFFIDTLNEIIKHYKNDLHDWLYVLLQRIFLKLGTDLLSSTHSNLLNTLELIKKSFPITLQMSCVNRFLVDATQTPTTKVKVTVLNHLSSLCNVAEPNQLATHPPAHQALHKIISFVQDAKSSAELRTAAKNCVIALWNCNTPQITMMLSELPKEFEDVASNIVHMHLRKNSVGSESGSPLVSSSPKTLSPTSPKNDDINQEEIYRSLRKTTAEIQNYSYETLGRWIVFNFSYECVKSLSKFCVKILANIKKKTLYVLICILTSDCKCRVKFCGVDK